MRQVAIAFVVTVMVWSVSACLSGNSRGGHGTKCEPGTSLDCTCTDGSQSKVVCTEDKAFSACQCDVPESDGTTGDDSGADTGDTTRPADVVEVEAPPDLKSIGEPCTENSECFSGLCDENDYAPFKWCTRTCQTELEACIANPRGDIEGWCIKMPDDFEGAHKQICLPLCKEIADCDALSPVSTLWEICDVPSYKGNPINTGGPGILVCGSPSAYGIERVEDDCSNWRDTSRAKKRPLQVNICAAYCDYMVKCNEVQKPYNQDCCGHGCLQNMITSEGKVDDLYQNKVQCYRQNFSANQGNPTVCTAHQDDPTCSGKPENPRPQ